MGTPAYLAPEVLDKEVAGPAVDVWGLGCVALEMATLRSLAERPTMLGVDLRSAPLHPGQLPARLSPALRQCIAAMLRAPPAERPVARDVAALCEVGPAPRCFPKALEDSAYARRSARALSKARAGAAPLARGGVGAAAGGSEETVRRSKVAQAVKGLGAAKASGEGGGGRLGRVVYGCGGRGVGGAERRRGGEGGGAGGRGGGEEQAAGGADPGSSWVTPARLVSPGGAGSTGAAAAERAQPEVPGGAAARGLPRAGEERAGRARGGLRRAAWGLRRVRRGGLLARGARQGPPLLPPRALGCLQPEVKGHKLLVTPRAERRPPRRGGARAARGVTGGRQGSDGTYFHEGCVERALELLAAARKDAAARAPPAPGRQSAAPAQPPPGVPGPQSPRGLSLGAPGAQGGAPGGGPPAQSSALAARADARQDAPSPGGEGQASGGGRGGRRGWAGESEGEGEEQRRGGAGGLFSMVAAAAEAPAALGGQPLGVGSAWRGAVAVAAIAGDALASAAPTPPREESPPDGGHGAAPAVALAEGLSAPHEASCSPPPAVPDQAQAVGDPRRGDAAARPAPAGARPRAGRAAVLAQGGQGGAAQAQGEGGEATGRAAAGREGSRVRVVATSAAPRASSGAGAPAAPGPLDRKGNASGPEALPGADGAGNQVHVQGRSGHVHAVSQAGGAGSAGGGREEAARAERERAREREREAPGRGTNDDDSSSLVEGRLGVGSEEACGKHWVVVGEAGARVLARPREGAAEVGRLHRGDALVVTQVVAHEVVAHAACEAAGDPRRGGRAAARRWLLLEAGGGVGGGGGGCRRRALRGERLLWCAWTGRCGRRGGRGGAGRARATPRCVRGRGAARALWGCWRRGGASPVGYACWVDGEEWVRLGGGGGARCWAQLCHRDREGSAAGGVEELRVEAAAEGATWQVAAARGLQVREGPAAAARAHAGGRLAALEMVAVAGSTCGGTGRGERWLLLGAGSHAGGWVREEEEVAGGQWQRAMLPAERHGFMT